MKKVTLNILVKIKDFTFRRLRVFIFCILVLLFLFSLWLSTKNMLPGWNDLWINIAAGFVGSLVTIYFIDILINQDKRRKFKSINESNHYTVKIIIQRLMVKVMFEFGFIDKKNAGELILSGSENKEFEKFIVDKRTENKIANLEFTKVDGEFLKRINKLLDEGYASILKAMKEFRPYPDPSIEQEILNKISPLTGFSSVGVDLIEIFYEKLPKEKGITTKSISEMIPGMKVLWKMFFYGRSEQSYKVFFDCNFKFLRNLYARALDGTLFWDI